MVVYVSSLLSISNHGCTPKYKLLNFLAEIHKRKLLMVNQFRVTKEPRNVGKHWLMLTNHSFIPDLSCYLNANSQMSQYNCIIIQYICLDKYHMCINKCLQQQRKITVMDIRSLSCCHICLGLLGILIRCLSPSDDTKIYDYEEMQ